MDRVPNQYLLPKYTGETPIPERRITLVEEKVILVLNTGRSGGG
jgi:hypothetical protein